jgi:hypothetical protein
VSLDLGSASFRLAAPGQLPGGLILRIAEAEKRPQEALGLFLRLARRLVHSDERDRFEAFLDSDEFLDLSAEHIQSAVSAAMESMTARPTGRSEPSQAGPPNTEGTSRVVSFSRGTVQAV